jgi:methyl-accepting chemotaxis protein
MTSGGPKIAKVLTNFETLSTVATSLNAASDELTKVVGSLDEALKKLNVGLTVWVPFRFREHPQADWYDRDQIGYTKVQGTWGLALRHIWGDEEDHHEDGPWLFKDAPRELRIECLDELPEVIEQLATSATATTKRVQEKAKQVRELAAAIDQVANANIPASLRAYQNAFAAAGKQGATGKLSDLAVPTKGSK